MAPIHRTIDEGNKKNTKNANPQAAEKNTQIAQDLNEKITSEKENINTGRLVLAWL